MSDSSPDDEIPVFEAEEPLVEIPAEVKAMIEDALSDYEEPEPEPEVDRPTENLIRAIMLEYGFSGGERPRSYTLTRDRDDSWRLFLYEGDRVFFVRLPDRISNASCRATILGVIRGFLL